MEIRIVESIIKRGTYKVWVKSVNGTGWLRGGFAWRTLGGAESAAKRYEATR